MNKAKIPLWRQLQFTAHAVSEVRSGRSLTPVLERVDGELRPGVQALSFQVMRGLGRAEALRHQLARRTPPEAVDALLCTALALIWRVDDAPYEPFTLVDQAVEAAKRNPATCHQASFVNACLRRFLRDRDQFLMATNTDPVARWNHPDWWVKRLKNDHPQHWEDILKANNMPGPMSLRINARRNAASEYMAALESADIKARRQGADGILLETAMPVQVLPGFSEGLVSVQDGGAQIAAPLLLQGFGSTPFLNILDACAAPGGKTAHLLESSSARVTALDIDPQRCDRIIASLKRLGLAARVVEADAAQADGWWDGEPFDAILLDAPCTASGIVRRHPDVRWLRRESDIAQLAGIQARLLNAMWPMLKPGGRMLYCTCSVFREEGSEQIKAFVANNTEAVLLASPGHLLPQLWAGVGTVQDNHWGDHDGFFYALLEKRQA